VILAPHQRIRGLDGFEWRPCLTAASSPSVARAHKHTHRRWVFALINPLAAPTSRNTMVLLVCHFHRSRRFAIPRSAQLRGIDVQDVLMPQSTWMCGSGECLDCLMAAQRTFVAPRGIWCCLKWQWPSYLKFWMRTVWFKHWVWYRRRRVVVSHSRRDLRGMGRKLRWCSAWDTS